MKKKKVPKEEIDKAMRRLFFENADRMEQDLRAFVGEEEKKEEERLRKKLEWLQSQASSSRQRRGEAVHPQKHSNVGETKEKRYPDTGEVKKSRKYPDTG